jgi:flagellar biosynthetic protein FliQ
MDATVVLDLGRDALRTCLWVAGPLLAVALVVGIVLGVLQTATQLHDMTVSFAGKLIAVGVALTVALPWFLTRLAEYTSHLIAGIPHRL